VPFTYPRDYTTRVIRRKAVATRWEAGIVFSFRSFFVVENARKAVIRWLATVDA